MTLREEKDACNNEIKSVDNKLNELITKINQLKKQEVIKEYLQLTNHVLKCIEHRNNLYKKYERLSLEDCNHPIWYYNNDKDIKNTKEKIVKCTCLLCGREKVAKESTFESRIIGLETKNVISYEEARKNYLEYEVKCSENKKVKKFIKKNLCKLVLQKNI